MKTLYTFLVFIFLLTTAQPQEITATLAGSSTSDGFSVKEGSNTLFRVRGDGNVGIGTTSPDAILNTYAISPQNAPRFERSWTPGTLYGELLNLVFTPSSGNAVATDGGTMSFIGEDDAGNEEKYAEVVATIEDPADGNEDGSLSFRTMENGTRTEQVRITEDGNVGIGTTGPQGALDVVSTTGALIVPRMTTTQRNALTAVNGMIIYNTSDNQFNFYENGAWATK